MFRKLKVKHVILTTALLCAIYILGLFTKLLEENYYTKFAYPYDGDITKSVLQLRNNEKPEINIINSYNYTYIIDCREKCLDNKIRLTYIVKSSLDHFENRKAIRETWGFQYRFSDVEIRTIFILGVSTDSILQSNINVESTTYHDIVQANFTDSYFNNTIKTMMGFKWAVKFCLNSNFYMFVDDDYYVSTKNVLRFIRNPVNYPHYLLKTEYDFNLPSNVRLYAGYVFVSSPHRHLFSKWHVSLQEYQYNKWPPYVTAGAYILSKQALQDMYYGSFYTKHFRFDDIYLGLIAKKVGIEPFHCEHFYFYEDMYNINKFTIASHGYTSPLRLSHRWNAQKELGNA